MTDGFTTDRISIGASQASVFPIVLAPYESRVFVVGTDVNLIRNGNFDAGIAQWNTYINTTTAMASGSADQGRFRIH